MAEDNDDRRRHRRITASLPIRVAGGEGSTRDLSESGIGLVSSEKLVAGQKLEIEVLLEAAEEERDGPLKTTATVMWSAATDTGAYSAGLQIEGASPEAVERLRKFLEAHGEEEG